MALWPLQQCRLVQCCYSAANPTTVGKASVVGKNSVPGRSVNFTHTVVREPPLSVAAGLREIDSGDPDIQAFRQQHTLYCDALRRCGVKVIALPALESCPDSVFIEDAALCFTDAAVVLHPGAPSRRAESASLRPYLQDIFVSVYELEGGGHVDGGDVLVTDTTVFAGLSARTDRAGLAALQAVVETLGYQFRAVDTPAGVLHFKSDCALLDPDTVLATSRLASGDCFDGLQVLVVPEGEEAAANCIRVNQHVLLSEGYPRTQELLAAAGYSLIELPTDQAALLDGGLSCLSLRFSLTAAMP